FCGSGIMALEAISRGSTRATLVERDRGKRKVIAENLALAEQTECPNPRVVFAPVEVFVAREKGCYDIVYLDPPFAYRHKADLLRRIARAGLVDRDGTLLIHYPSGDDLPESLGKLTMTDERRYGRSVIRFYRHSASDE
ncbi:MAG: RsmD family RNA methyltransferase, partial [Spirochaetota bacterium]